MLLFRSEEDVERWCRRLARAPGAILPLPRLQRLATRWYGDRLDPDWRPRTREESQRILAEVGLSGDFWQLA